MKRRLKVYLALAFALVVAWAMFEYFNVETRALSWHLRHGFHAELLDVRLKVPFSYEARDPGSFGSLLITRFGGRVWHGGGMISVDLGQHRSPQARQAAKAMLPKVNPNLTLNKVREQRVMFAGRPGNCIEYIPQFDDASLQKQMEKADMLDIECSFGDDAEALFMGTSNLKSDFYNVIETAEAVKRKN